MLGVMAPLLSLLGIEASVITDRIKRQIILWGLIAVFGVIFVAFLLVAAHAALVEGFGPIIAPLIMAVVAGVLAVITFLVLNLLNASAAKKQAEHKRQHETNSLLATSIISAVPLVLKSSLLREVALPAGAAIASILILMRQSRRPKD
jgi:cobalamin synthase